MKFKALLFALALFVGCAKPAPAPEPHKVGAIAMRGSGLLYNASDGVPSLTALGHGDGGAHVLCTNGSSDTWCTLTADQIAPAFAPTLTFATGSGTYELGATSTPTYNASPLTNSATVTGSTLADNQGNGPTSVSSGSALAAPSGSHTYALTSAGTVTVTLSETLVATGTTKTATASLSYVPRWYCGVDSHSGATGATASTNNATLTGGSASATLTGTLAAVAVGTTCTITPSSQYWYGLMIHTSSAHTFTDGLTGFSFSASVVATITFTNQFSVATSFDLYRSDFLLSGTFAPKVAS